jgi:hypothetical protein
MNDIKVGQRIVINKSDIGQEQLLPQGERGTILSVVVSDDYRILLSLELDNGSEVFINNTEFRFETYDK